VFSTVFVLTTQLIMSSLNVQHQFMYFRVLIPLVRFIRSPQPKRKIVWLLLFGIYVLYLHKSNWTSYLHMFRRIPASTRSDWHFTAFQNSSENFATFTRSILLNLALERSSSFGSNRNNLSDTILENEIISYIKNILISF
jgi:hypothetical protein